eukprot:3714683-Amphidinium_carterae.1
MRKKAELMTHDTRKAAASSPNQDCRVCQEQWVHVTGRNQLKLGLALKAELLGNCAEHSQEFVPNGEDDAACTPDLHQREECEFQPTSQSSSRRHIWTLTSRTR